MQKKKLYYSTLLNIAVYYKTLGGAEKNDTYNTD